MDKRTFAFTKKSKDYAIDFDLARWRVECNWREGWEKEVVAGDLDACGGQVLKRAFINKLKGRTRANRENRYCAHIT